MLLLAAAHARLIGHYPLAQEPRFGWELALIALVLVATYAAGVTETNVPFGSRFLRAAGAVGSAIVILSLAQVATQQPLLPRFFVGMTFVAVIPLQTLMSALGEHSRVQKGQQERVVAVLGVEEEMRLTSDIVHRPERPAVIKACVDVKEVLPTDEDVAPLETLVKDCGATLLVLAREAQSVDDLVVQAVALHRRGVRVRTLSLFYDEWLGKLPVSELERIALLFDINEIHRPLYARVKRFLDLSFALPGLALLLVLAPLVAVGDLIGNRGPLFFRQPRIGKDGVTFTILKFRTMTTVEGAGDWTAADDARLTPFGRLMRRTHIDELPQMWNVVRRDLSIVGPRPEQPHYVARLAEQIPFYDTRHLVRPGLTGWAQVKYDYGASELDALEKLQYEFYYLRHQSLALDLRIMGRTLRSVVGLRGR